ncbi:MAG: right-handed parallel beta-helix repeat-containing protein, partial [Candidatus Bipolaricaulia bacterium]
MKVRVLRGRLWIALLAAVVTAVTTLGQTTINLNPGDDIQAAIGAASGGDTIVLAPGVYDVPKTIVVNKSLMISSAGATLQGTTPSALCVLEVAASNVTISGLGITWATLLESTVAGAELTDSLVRIPANLYLSGVVIVGNTIYLPAQSGAMSTWVARALTIGRNGCTDVTIASNTVYNTRNGIVLQYNNTATLTGNVIYATKGGIMNYTNTLADAANRTMSDNSWGTAHNEWDIVWNSANYDPDYQESVIALSASNGGAYVVDRRDSAGGHAVGNRSHIFVNLAGTTAVSEVNGNPNLPYATIGLAITGVADDGTIYVAEGTWQEQVVLSTDKSLIGSGSGTVIESPVTLTQFFSTGATKNYPIIYIHDAESASVRDLIVDGLGRGNSNYRFIGIGFYNAGGTVDGVEIRNIRNTPFSGAQHGVGLYAYNVDGTPRGLVISSSTIRDFQKNAMAIMGTGLTVTVTGNVIVGAGPTTVTAQNGVQLSSGAAGTIQDNSISGIWYTGAGWAASSILIFDAADGVAVVGNTITGGQVGVYGYLTDDLVIERNVIE